MALYLCVSKIVKSVLVIKDKNTQKCNDLIRLRWFQIWQ